MQKSSDYKTSNGFALLLLGRAGSGKTTLACQFPSPFVLDCDNNLAGAIRFLKDKSPFFYETINTDSAQKETPRMSRYGLATKALTEAAASPDIKTLVVDSITTFHEYILDEVRRQKHLSLDDNLRIQDWQSVATLWKEIITRLRTTGKYIIFTGHTRLDKDELDGAVYHQVLIQGQMKDQIAGLFSDCWLAQVSSKLNPTTRSMDAEYNIRVLQDAKFLDLKNSLGLPNIFPSDPKQFLDKL
jgi:hypothetical protein